MATIMVALALTLTVGSITIVMQYAQAQLNCYGCYIDSSTHDHNDNDGSSGNGDNSGNSGGDNDNGGSGN